MPPAAPLIHPKSQHIEVPPVPVAVRPPPPVPVAQRPTKFQRTATDELSPERYYGTICVFYPEKRYGFIKCDAVERMFAKDTFLSDMEVGNFKVGDAVSFTLAVKEGKPQARRLQVHSSAQ